MVVLNELTYNLVVFTVGHTPTYVDFPSNGSGAYRRDPDTPSSFGLRVETGSVPLLY